jgi:uroporphyrinogen-III decarboxylase
VAKKAEDFGRHNEEVKKLWEDYRAGRPTRVPVVFGINPRFVILDKRLNKTGLDFRTYLNDPKVMLETQLAFFEYVRSNVPQDAEMGLPAAWDVYVDMQNYYEAGFLGAEVYYPEGNVPVARAFLSDDRKRALLDRGPIDLDKNALWRRNVETYEYLLARKKEGYTYKGRPIGNVNMRGLGTDGQMTLLMSVRGANGLLDMYVDEAYFREMMEYLTEFAVGMIRKARRIVGQEERQEKFGFADDSVELLSAEEYKRFVLPYHKRLFGELGGKGPNSIHLCGDAQRHFPTLVKELAVNSIDTGFPVRWETLRDEVGEGVEISGGVHVEILRRGTAAEVREESRRILQSGIMRGGRFILREANNLPPEVPIANLQAMCDAAREFGGY